MRTCEGAYTEHVAAEKDEVHCPSLPTSQSLQHVILQDSREIKRMPMLDLEIILTTQSHDLTPENFGTFFR